MIFQLMKRDPLWKTIPYVVAAALLRGVLFGGNGTEFVLAFAFPVFVFAAAFVPRVQATITPFWAPLPIKVRDVYTARALVMTALFWLPLAVTVPWVNGWSSLELVAFATLVTLILQSAFIMERGVPLWLYFLLLAPLGAGGVAKNLSPEWFRDVRAEAVVSVCLVASLSLFLWMWNSLPLSFPATYDCHRLANRSEAASSQSSVPKWALLRVVCPWQYTLWVGVVFLQTMSMSFIAGPFLAFGLIAAQQSSQWIFALPISRRRLLPLFLTPLLLSALAGLKVRALLPWGGQVWGNPLDFAMSAVLLLTLSFTTLTVILTSCWRPLRTKFPSLKWVPSTIVFICWMTVIMAPVLHVFRVVVPVAWNTRDARWLVAGMASTLYLLADKLFREAEFPSVASAVRART